MFAILNVSVSVSVIVSVIIKLIVVDESDSD